MREFADEEAAAARDRIADRGTRTLQRLLLPRDPDDDRDVILEIRAGTGGDESALFAGDLLRMYLRYAERQRWQTELISRECLGPRRLQGGDRARRGRVPCTRKLKFESGTHRVQRVPETEAQGRIHTSACTVACCPRPTRPAKSQIDPDELRIDVFRASGRGRPAREQDRVGGADHAPAERHRGRVPGRPLAAPQPRQGDEGARAPGSRTARRSEAQAKEAAQRKSLVGSGDRSERIRTYNFPQGRVTDHRINLTLYKLDRIMAGELDEVIDALAAAQQARQLEALSEELAV